MVLKVFSNLNVFFLGTVFIDRKHLPLNMGSSRTKSAEKYLLVVVDARISTEWGR